MPMSVMKVLGIETSTERCSVALLHDGETHVDEILAGQRHSELLLGMIAGLLTAQGVSLRDLDGIAFGAGPGSFTGLRIACGVAQGMAFGTSKQLVGISSLLALAENAHAENGATRVVAALDARMGESYLAAFQRVERRGGAEWKAVIEPCLVDANSLPRMEGSGWCATGGGFEVHGYLARRYNTQLGSVLSGRFPGAREIVRLAARDFAAGLGLDPALASPMYIRNKVAMTSIERAATKENAAERVKERERENAKGNDPAALSETVKS